MGRDIILTIRVRIDRIKKEIESDRVIYPVNIY